MERIRALYQKYREPITYLFFGGLTTLVNIGLFTALTAWTPLPTALANALALAASILFAYATNRRWVFESRKTGLAALREFVLFVGCRVLTGFLDEAIVVLGVDRLGPSVPLDPLLWATAVKLFANILVILANYVFSKVLIFKKGEE